jgi:hypothetical protein
MSKIVTLTIALAIASFFLLGSSPERVAAVSCADFPDQASAQQYLRSHPWDAASVGAVVGIACKDLPCPCDRFPVTNTNVASPTPTATATSTATATAVPTSTLPPVPTATTGVVAPTATTASGSGLQAPISPADGGQTRSVILPPSTGDAGMR